MLIRIAVASFALAVVASAQSFLQINPAIGALQYLWVPAPAANPVGFFMDMTVTNPITIQGLTFPTYTPVGKAFTVDFYTTNPGLTTYVGNEVTQGNWTLRSSASATVPASPTTPNICFGAGVQLNPGTFGVAIVVRDANNLFSDLGPQTISNPDLSVTVGAVSAQAFTVLPSAYGTTAFHFNGTLFYTPGLVTGSCATRTASGRGCNATAGSFYQKWSTNAAMSAALSNRALSLINTGSGYLLVPGTTPFIAPTAAATSLPPSNNGDALVTLPSPFSLSYPGGSTSQLVINTDGHISTVSNLPFPGNNYNFMPYAKGMLDAVNPIWAVCWHNFNTTELNSGLIKWEVVGNLFVVTWDNVESLPGTAATQNPNPCTFQAQFDLITGNVDYVYGTMTTIGGSQSYDESIIGWSPGGPSPDVGPINVATLVSLSLTVPETLGLELAASAAPLLGTTVDLVTSNPSNSGVGVNFVSLGLLPAPGIDLTPLNAPGCFAYVDINTSIGNLISNIPLLPPLTISLPVPNTLSLAGLAIGSQSVWLDAVANGLGLLTSNGVSLTLGTFGF
ncbi:MAG: hypothetical protein MUC36_03335 [Planctomycetes bacterium]|jgi:hypothetical protein|nr:hypothetical protein [Planctomycetota bacterium]